ncbi:MAG: double zinc ribbon domain-containing protein [Candidatus Roseilinea sp.]|uniref:double zinc ribbon domain-containing protein n=1 Tax=Candidatus Roseilinea sp. TaxID=2838777 RepID=UPI0040491907
MIENISNLIVAAAAVIGAISAALLAGMAIWTFRDIRSRSNDVLVQILATVMVAVVPVAGILVYFMLRPRETLAEAYVRALEEESLLASIEHQEFCPSCGRRVDSDMQFCPSCHTRLRNACPGCGRAVHLSWDLCPYCGTTLTPELPVVRKPAARQISHPQTSTAPARAITDGATAQPRRIARPGATRQLQPLTETLPADTTSTRERVSLSVVVSDLLDKMGGAIERVVDRISAGKPQEANTQPQDNPLPEPPLGRRATERLTGELYATQTSPRAPQKAAPRQSNQTATQPGKPVSPGANGQTSVTGGTTPIKPLISRDEPLE